MKARLGDLSLTFDGKQRLTLELDDDFRGEYDRLKGKDLRVEIKAWREKRSRDANAMMWALCEQIAKAIRSTKEQVYRDQIRQVGEYTPLPIRADAVEDFGRIWSGHGIGWFVEVVDDSKLPGYKLVFAYNGSSTYDTKQMSRLIDSVIQEANELGIETMSDRERSLLLDAWAPR